MYLKIKEGKLKELLEIGICKAGSLKNLLKILGTSKSSIFEYIKLRPIPEEIFDRLVSFVELKNPQEVISEKLEKNWKQIKGGKKCVLLKKKNGTFDKEMKMFQELQSAKLKKWHKSMRNDNPEEYYLIQYSRFKKVGEYKFITKRGEKVRNLLEKQVADILYGLNINYLYEPLVHVGNHYFFPDFVIENEIIVECTAWKGSQKAYKLRDKIEILKSKYKVFVVIPKTLYSYYRLLDKNHLVLGLDDFVPVAQTFPIPKGEEGSNR